MINGLELKMFSRAGDLNLGMRVSYIRDSFIFLLGSNYDCLNCSMNLHK